MPNTIPASPIPAGVTATNSIATTTVATAVRTTAVRTTDDRATRNILPLGSDSASAAPRVNLRASRILASGGVLQPILLGAAVLTDGTTAGLSVAVACHIADVVAAKPASPDCLPPTT